MVAAASVVTAVATVTGVLTAPALAASILPRRRPPPLRRRRPPRHAPPGRTERERRTGVARTRLYRHPDPQVLDRVRAHPDDPRRAFVARSDWIERFAVGLGSGEVVVILEPDSVARAGCLSAADRAARFASLARAGRVLKAAPPRRGCTTTPATPAGTPPAGRSRC
ncbi:hypothetical protein GCM10010254_45620 [Streptomyces chromofuscus]|nr:hypothetical protein GCM10010254_45620 [Streptomyces chromofuscus]